MLYMYITLHSDRNFSLVMKCDAVVLFRAHGARVQSTGETWDVCLQGRGLLQTH